MVYFFAFFFLAVSAYTFIPTVLFRFFSSASFKREEGSAVVYLTFDDGPDPLYTPKLLDILKRYGAKATFFVVGERAEEYPELIKRMQDEGHTIGLHNYKHASNWFLGPFSFQSQLKKCAAALEGILGEKPVYYRPPWGHFNLFSWLAYREFKVIMWKYAPRDWKAMPKDKLTRRLLNNLNNGSVILLHDCGDTVGADNQAPLVMMESLQEVFEQIKNKGILFDGIGKLGRDSKADVLCVNGDSSKSTALFRKEGAKHE